MRELKMKRVYKHFKGDYYLVEDIAYDSETKEKMVVYRHLYGDGSLCVRPLDMFLSEVGVRIDIWTHFMRECIINYVH